MAYIDDVYLVVNIAPVGIPTYVRLSQNENGRKLYFAVTGGEIPSGSTATMSGTKPDGVVYSKAGSISGNTVTFSEDIQLTAVAGEWPAKIVIVNGGQTVMTARIRFAIDADTVAAGAVPSDSQLEGLVAQAAAYAEAAKDGAFYGSPLVASTVAEMTDKTRVYVYTGSESGYTSGNWYYWSGSAWTSGGVYNATAVSTDTTLSIAGKAADAKATGDAIAAVTIPTDKTLTVSDAPADAKVVGDELADLKDDFTRIESYLAHIGISESVKIALLSCFKKVAWVDELGQTYYDALETALYEADYPRIVASFSPGSRTIYIDEGLAVLPQYLTVKYQASRDSADVIIPSTDYMLSGALSAGDSVIRVSYNDLSTTFIVTAVDYYNQTQWTLSSGLLDKIAGNAVSYTGWGPAISTSNQNRRTFYAKRGLKPFADHSDGTPLSGIYPIPIPDGYNHVNVKITPSTQYLYVTTRSYINGEYSRYAVNDLPWQSSERDANVSVVEDAKMFLVVASKYDSTGTTYPTEPTELTVTFSKIEGA